MHMPDHAQGGVLTCLAVTLNDYLGQKVHGRSSFVRCGRYSADFHEVMKDLSWLPGCYPTSVPGTIIAYWIASVVVECKNLKTSTFSLLNTL